MFPPAVPRTWLIAGLGNPGPEYERTPHNAGFLAVDRFAERHGIRVTRKESKALTGVGEFRGCHVMLAKPQTFMNLSGTSVSALVTKFALDPKTDLLVVYDELDIPWGEMRLKPKGSAAGHNGMKSIIGSLGHMEFARLRIGVHPGHPLDGGTDYLLSPVRRGLRVEWEEILGRAADAIESVIAEGVEKTMTIVNRRAGGLTKEEA